MKKNSIIAASLLSLAIALPGCSDSHSGNKLVILHTNDTHSQIVPGNDGLGGVMRRRAVIDSIRAAEKNVLVVDAGDAVQGTLYFYLYGGRVEQEMLNILGVDVRILGNHEFDNGIDSLAAVLRYSDAEKISTNYDLSNTPLADMFQPYLIKEYGGKKIGILGINLDPEGMITKGHYDGLEFLPIVATANLTAEKLRKEDGVDAVIALTHIGYNPSGLIGDSILATNSRGIDIIIGGHSHDTIDPTTEQGARRSRLKNLDGEEVLVVQTGKAGRKLGKIEIDLDSLGLGASPKYELISIDNRYDSFSDPVMEEAIMAYSMGVDSLMQHWIGETNHPISSDSHELINFFSDFVKEKGGELAPGVELAIANKGGLRASIPQGRFSKGHIINMVPFSNYVTVLDVRGSDLAEIFDIMARTDGNGVSDNVKVSYVKNQDGARAKSIIINGRKLDPMKTYRVATIDYLAKGGDYMSPFTRGYIVAQDSVPVFNALLDHIEKRGSLGSDTTPRWTLEK